MDTLLVGTDIDNSYNSGDDIAMSLYLGQIILNPYSFGARTLSSNKSIGWKQTKTEAVLVSIDIVDTEGVMNHPLGSDTNTTTSVDILIIDGAGVSDALPTKIVGFTVDIDTEDSPPIAAVDDNTVVGDTVPIVMVKTPLEATVDP